ncbi:MAG: glycosyltransferase family 4 protein [Candidatus Helarchaeota archaeon]|nr:glycosyltransferase family 4 protein [Candidatus Helarchaeota archaeon]
MITTAWRRRREYEVAYVEVYSGKAFFWAQAVCLVLRLAAKPYVLNLHGGALPSFARRWPGPVTRLLHSAVAVVTPSPYLFEKMKPYCQGLHIIPNGLSLQSYPPKIRVRPRPHLVWLRAFHTIYNPTLAPRVLSLLHKEFPDINLVMVGPDKEDGSLSQTRQTASDFGVANMVDFPGQVAKEEVPLWLQKGDIFLNTTDVDNTPVSVIEAMACGLCIVSTDVGGIPYLLQHEHDALLVPPDDPDAMARAVQRIFAEPGLAEYLSRNARQKAEHFDWSLILPKWEELFTMVAERREL